MFLGSLIGAERFGVKIHKTIQRRVHLRRGGHERLDSALRMCGTLYNASLEHWKTAYKTTRDNPKPHSVTYAEQSKDLTGIRKDDPEGWGSLSRSVGRGVVIRRDRASQAFFRRVKHGEAPGYPRFKASARYRTIDVEDAASSMVRVAGTKAHIRIKGLPVMELRCKTPLPPSETLKAIRITRYPIGVYAALPTRSSRSRCLAFASGRTPPSASIRASTSAARSPTASSSSP